MMRDYEPALTQEGTPALFPEPEIYPGVRGYAIETADKLIFIPSLEAVKEGGGAVGEFLDRISLRCRIVNVVNPRLEGMLRRRGFKLTIRGTVDGPVDVWAPPRGAREGE